MTTSTEQRPRHGERSRAKLSREAIVLGGLALLEQQPLEEFSMNRLARSLGAGAMSLYTYFPSRDALMLSLADEIFSRFAIPPERERWQDSVTDWLWATVAHLDQNPVALKLAQWEGHVAPAWLKTWFPLVSLIKRQGLEGQDLAFAVSWFTTAAMGFIKAQLSSPYIRQSQALHFIDELELDDQRLAAGLWFDLKSLDRDTTLAFGFDNLVSRLEQHIEVARSSSDAMDQGAASA